MCTTILTVLKHLYKTNRQLTRTIHKYPDLNLEYLCNPDNAIKISENISRRKGVGDIKAVQELYNLYAAKTSQDEDYDDVKQKLYAEASKIPNDSHNDVIKYADEPHIIKHCGTKPEFSFPPKEFHDITKQLNLMRTLHLGTVAGNRSYYFLGALSEMEHALIRFTVSRLVRLGFRVVSVPDVLRSDVIESCGMSTKGERTQIYRLDSALHGEGLCLSGTSEMAIAGLLRGKVFAAESLPMQFMAVSRCYRAETSSTAEEKGIYRVHQFTKVEMFTVTDQESSDKMLETLRSIEENLYSSLGLHFKTLDMPCHELGAPAYRKYDIEAWLAGRNMYGEISSCSNCTDYQSRRLNIKYKEGNVLKYVHTLNGTACAIPRMLIALLETYQNENGTVRIPDALQPYMRNRTEICKEKRVPELKLIKMKR